MTVTLLVPTLGSAYKGGALNWADQGDRARFISNIERLGYEVGFHSEYGRQAIRIEAALTKIPQDLVDAGLEFLSFEMVRANVPVTSAKPGTYEGGSVEHDRGITAHVETCIRRDICCQTFRVTGTELSIVGMYLENLIAGRRNQDCMLSAAPDDPAGLHLNKDKHQEAQDLVSRLHDAAINGVVQTDWHDHRDWPQMVKLLKLSDPDTSSAAS